MKRKEMFGILFIAICMILYLHLTIAAECGDFICDTDEEATCPSDCTGQMPDNIAVCGDFFCDTGEETSCSQDCDSNITQQINVSSNETENVNVEVQNVSQDAGNETGIGQETGGDLATEPETTQTGTIAPTEVEGESFFSGIGFKILILVIVLVIIGVVGFVFWRKQKSSEMSQGQVSEQNVQSGQVNSQ